MNKRNQIETLPILIECETALKVYKHIFDSILNENFLKEDEHPQDILILFRGMWIKIFDDMEEYFYRIFEQKRALIQQSEVQASFRSCSNYEAIEAHLREFLKNQKIGD